MLKQFPTTSLKRNQVISSEYSRILSAAVINSKFRAMLLSDPVKAVSCGYSGEQFSLDREDQNRLATIHASSLAEFAAQLSEI
jgi:hypothetical protein